MWAENSYSADQSVSSVRAMVSFPNGVFACSLATNSFIVLLSVGVVLPIEILMHFMTLTPVCFRQNAVFTNVLVSMQNTTLMSQLFKLCISSDTFGTPHNRGNMRQFNRFKGTKG